MSKHRPPCAGVRPLTPLSTANRPGLDELAYRVGTHASFLESMLARLTTHKIEHRDPGGVIGNTSSPLLDLRIRTANDPSIAILDAWSTISDLLTFYNERLANEGYLRTANERRSLEELARLVGYQLKPGLSANTHLAFEIEQDSAPVIIPKGTPAATIPGPGELPQTFETSYEIEARPDWNEINPKTTRYPYIREANALLVSKLYAAGTTLNLKQNDLLLFKFDDGTPIPRFVQRLELDSDNSRTVIHLRESDIGFPAYVRKIRESLQPLFDALAENKWEYEDSESTGAAVFEEKDTPKFIRDRRETRTKLRNLLSSGRDIGLSDFDAKLGDVITELSEREDFDPFFKTPEEIGAKDPVLKPLIEIRTYLNDLGTEQAFSEERLGILFEPLHKRYADVHSITAKTDSNTDLINRVIDINTAIKEGADLKELITEDGAVTQLITFLDDILEDTPGNLVAKEYGASVKQWKKLVNEIDEETSDDIITRLRAFFSNERSQALLNAIHDVSGGVPDLSDQPPLHLLVRIADDRFRIETRLAEDAPAGFEPAQVRIVGPEPAELPDQLDAAEKLLFKVPESIAKALLSMDDLQLNDRQLTPIERGMIRYRAQNILALTVEGRFDSVEKTGVNDNDAPLTAELTELLKMLGEHIGRDTGSEIADEIGKHFKELIKNRSPKRIPIIGYFESALSELADINQPSNINLARRFQRRIGESFAKCFYASNGESVRFDPGTLDGAALITSAAAKEANSIAAAQLGDHGDDLILALLKFTNDVISANENDAAVEVKQATLPNPPATDPNERITAETFRIDWEKLKSQISGQPSSWSFADVVQLIQLLKDGLTQYLGDKNPQNQSGYPRFINIVDPEPVQGDFADPRLESAAGAVVNERRSISKKIQDRIKSILTSADQIGTGVPPLVAKIKAEAEKLKPGGENGIEGRHFIADIRGKLKTFLDVVLTDEESQLTPQQLLSGLPRTRDGNRARTVFADLRTQYLQLSEAKAVERFDLDTFIRIPDRTVAGLNSAAGDLEPKEFSVDAPSDPFTVARATTTDLNARLLQTFNPQLRDGLFTAWRNVPPVRPKFSVFAFQHRASLFGHSAARHSGEPYKPGSQNADQEWTTLRENNKVVHLEREFADVSPTLDRLQGPPPGDETAPISNASFIALAELTIAKEDNEAANTALAPPPDVYNIEDVATISRSAYGISGKTTRIELDRDWWTQTQGTTKITPLRNTSAFVAPYEIELVEEPFDLPIGRVNRNDDPNGGNAREEENANIPEHLLEQHDNEIEIQGLTRGLQTGRTLVVSGERADAPGVQVQETVKLRVAKTIWRDWPKELPHTLLVLENDLEFAYRRDSVKVFANVVEATHGATESEEILGNGDATKQFQKFTLAHPNVSHLPSVDGSAAKPELKVRVNEVLWDRRENVLQLGRNEAYNSRVAGASTVVGFGDGKHGLRLPTGIENVRAVYRTGIGKSGNVKREQISQLPKPVLGVTGVKNPVQGTGGVDPESVYLGRESSSRYSSALGRLISLADYVDFARNFGGVAKSTAFELFEAGRPVIKVVVAMMGDVVPIGDRFKRNLEMSLRRGSEAELEVRVEERILAVLSLKATVGVDQRFRPDAVLAEIERVLRDRFSFERADFGDTIRRSEAVQLMQSVRGVQYVRMEKFGVVKREDQPADNSDSPANGGGAAPSGGAGTPNPGSPGTAAAGGSGDAVGEPGDASPENEQTNGSGNRPQPDPLAYLNLDGVKNNSNIKLGETEIAYFPPEIDQAIRLTAEGGTP